MREDDAFQGSMQKIEELIGTLERAGDPALRSAAKQLVSALMDVHGACLSRMLGVLNQAGELGQQAIDSFVNDSLIRNLLILYELHPVELDVRVAQAMDKFRGSHAATGVKAEVLSTDGGNIRVRYSSESKGCGSGALKATIEAAILEAAPDVNAIFVEDASPVSSQSFVPLSALGAATLPSAPIEQERSSNRA
jgi:hypothetical protein